MIRGRVLTAIFTVCLFCQGCSNAPGVDIEAAAQEIRELDRQWQAAFDAKDMEAAMRHFADDAQLMPAGTPTIVGKDSIYAWYDRVLSIPGVSNKFGPDVVEVAASGDLAYDKGRYEFVMETPDGIFRDTGRYLVIWKKIEGEWKVILDISNNDHSAPELVSAED